MMAADKDGNLRTPGFNGCGNIPALVDVDGEGAIDPAEIRLKVLENLPQVILQPQV